MVQDIYNNEIYILKQKPLSACLQYLDLDKY